MGPGSHGGRARRPGLMQRAGRRHAGTVGPDRRGHGRDAERGAEFRGRRAPRPADGPGRAGRHPDLHPVRGAAVRARRRRRGLHGHGPAYVHAAGDRRERDPGQRGVCQPRARARHRGRHRRRRGASRRARGGRGPEMKAADGTVIARRSPMRWLVARSLRFRYLVVGLALALMYFGAQTLGHQKVDVFPEFAPVSVEIQTACLGLSPSEVESLTTVPLEAALAGVPGVGYVSSFSEPQLSAIYLYFRSGTDELHARQLVQERLQATAHTLPTWCDFPQMYPIVSATSRVMQVGLTSKTISAMDMSMIAQYTIRPKLMAVPGVANVAIWGFRNRQIMVEADPAKMAANGISLDTLESAAADAIDSGELKYTSGAAVGSLGSIQVGNQQLDVYNVQPIHLATQMATVPLVQKDGKFVRMGDVASVTYGYPPLAGDAVINGGAGLMLVIEKFPGANTVDVTNGILQAFSQIQPGLPGVKINSQIFRQATFIEMAIHNLTLAVVIGCVLVVFVLFPFLFQWRAAVVSLLAIPLSLGAAAIVLDLMGTTINTMIPAGFAVAVGVVVDYAIIDMENIVRRLRAWR